MKPIVLLSFAFLSLNISGSHHATKQGLQFAKFFMRNGRALEQTASQITKAPGLTSTARASFSGWTPPTVLPKFQLPPLIKQSNLSVPLKAYAPLAGVAASSGVHLSATDLQALWNGPVTSTGPSLIPFAPPTFEGFGIGGGEEPTTPVVERPAAPGAAPETIQTDEPDSYEDQGANPYALPEENEEEIIPNPVEPLAENEEQDPVRSFADEDVILFTPEDADEDLIVASPTTPVVENPTTPVVEIPTIQRIVENPTTQVVEAPTTQVVEPLVDTALVLVDNSQDLNALQPVETPAKPTVEPLTTIQKVITATLGAGTAAVIAVKTKKPGPAKQLVKGIQKAATAIKQPAISAVQQGAKELTAPLPKQTRYFTQETFKKSTSNGKTMLRHFKEEADFRADMAKFHPKEASKTTPPTPKVKTPAQETKSVKTIKVVKNPTILPKPKETSAKPKQAPTKTTTKAVPAEQPVKTRKKEEARVREDAARLEREEATRLKKQAEDEVAKLDAQTKQVEEARVRAEEARVREEEARLKAEAEIKDQEEADAAQFKRNQDALDEAAATLKTQQAKAKKTLPKKQTSKAIDRKKMNPRSLAPLGRSAKKPVTPVAATPQPKKKLYLPKLKPLKAAPKPAAPAKEEPKKEEKKEDPKKEELKPEEGEEEEELENSSEEELRPEEEEYIDEEDSLVKTIIRKKPTEKKEELKNETAPATPPATPPHETAKKALAPVVSNAAIAIRNGWASKINVEPTPPLEPHVPSTAELNEQAARQRTVELPFGNSEPLVVPTAKHSLPGTPQTAIQNAHPESNIPVPNISLAKVAAPKATLPLGTAIIHDEHAQAAPQSPEIFPTNLAAEKESDAQLAFDFGKEVIRTTVIQPLKQLAHYVVETISGWFK